jgi:hypothetical protein
MRPRERRETSEQDLFRSRLDQIIDMKHGLVKLARAIDWRFLEERFGAVYTDKPGQPPLPTRLMAGLAARRDMYFIRRCFHLTIGSTKGPSLAIGKTVAFAAHLVRSRARELPSLHLAVAPFGSIGGVAKSKTDIWTPRKIAGISRMPAKAPAGSALFLFRFGEVWRKLENFKAG